MIELPINMDLIGFNLIYMCFVLWIAESSTVQGLESSSNGANDSMASLSHGLAA